MKLFVVPIGFKFFIHCVIGVVALSSAAFASEMQVASMREQTVLDLMLHGKAKNDCFLYELCCPAVPITTRTTGNDDQPSVGDVYFIPSFNSAVRSISFFLEVARFDVALRILYCCWRN